VYACYIKRKKGNTGIYAVKLDMHKAYDRVEWTFLERIMLKMGFDQRWVDLIMACVTSVRYSVRFNSVETGILTEPWIKTRGPLVTLFISDGGARPLFYAEGSRTKRKIRRNKGV
jgi:hypothetical protein